MLTARARLLLAATLLAAWIGWLGYQSVTRGRDYPVLSQSQFLVSNLVVIADVEAGDVGRPNPLVTIREVRWPMGQIELVGKAISVTNLASSTGFRGSGQYILPLVAGEIAGEYRVAGLPRSPGFDSYSATCFIYPVLPVTLQQWDAVRKSN